MEAQKIDRQLDKLKADYEQTMRFKMSAYENFVDHLLSEAEFKQYQRVYTEKCEAIAAAKRLLTELKPKEDMIDEP